MKKLFNRNYDIEGNELARVCRTYFRSRVIPLGSFGTGPGLRCLLVFTVLHYFSAPVFYVFVRKENTVRRIYQKLKNFLRK
jgi:hypothetical protein